MFGFLNLMFLLSYWLAVATPAGSIPRTSEWQIEIRADSSGALVRIGVSAFALFFAFLETVLKEGLEAFAMCEEYLKAREFGGSLRGGLFVRKRSGGAACVSASGAKC